MTQCEEQIVEPMAQTPAQSDASGWVLLGIVAGVIVYELWAIFTGRPTISQWVKRKTNGRAWWKAFGMGVIGLTLWHLFFGGPL